MLDELKKEAKMDVLNEILEMLEGEDKNRMMKKPDAVSVEVKSASMEPDIMEVGEPEAPEMEDAPIPEQDREAYPIDRESSSKERLFKLLRG